MGIFNRFFKDSNKSTVKELGSFVERIRLKEKEYGEVSDQELKEKSISLKNQITQETVVQDILPEAFALVCEAAFRHLAQRPFDVQLMGGMALHQGKIAEMRTGEGKTLTATLPVYLNALAGKGVHVITVNDYLAKRDAVWMGQVYNALGLSVGCITHSASYIYDPAYGQEAQNSKSKTQNDERDETRDTLGSFQVEESYLRPVTRKEAYGADITYGTNNEYGFDYLRDNMAYDKSQQVQRGHFFAIIDEVDSILIDEARTPLIISAPDQESSSWYKDFARFIPQLEQEIDYVIDEKLKAVTLTEQGIDKVEKLLGAKDIYEEKGIKYLHHLEQALKAQALFQKDKDYVVQNGQIIIVDEFTGRMLPGRRYSGGLHQALEAKEGVQVQPESLTLASITFQNYFRLYDKLAGMTGTAATSAEEFFKVYKLEVVAIPSNKSVIRQDLPDKVYATQDAKWKAVVQEVKERSQKGQPVLVGTVSIERNEKLGRLLQVEGVPHTILNAKQHEQEGRIIAQAGKQGAVTVATNMAGRGVDIILGGNPPNEKETQAVRDLGGLFVLGTERHEARRIDNQLRGRTGRQGDPGASQFFVSLDDEVIRVFGGERMQGILKRLNLPADQAIESGLVSNAIESAQSKIEGLHFDSRKHLLEFDDVLNKHRNTMYKKRQDILEQDAQEISAEIQELVVRSGFSQEQYKQKEQELGKDTMQRAERVASLRAIDTLWMEHLENMEELRDSVRLRAYGQQDPLIEYKNEGHTMFQDLLSRIEHMRATMVMQAQLTQHNHRHAHAQNNVSTTAIAPKTVGRNDPCPCNSGKKWKHCGLINAPTHKQ
jgi:preprotein translocase subunit SecA